MKDCNCNNKGFTVEHVLDTDVDDLASVPDYFLAVRTVKDPSTDVTIATPVRVPGEKILPVASMQNIAALTTNNPDLTIPDNQVRAGYIDVQPGGNIVRLTDTNNAPMFLLVKNYTNGKVLVQTTGFLRIPTGHSYIVGQTYYDDGTGIPTTDSTTGRKLFRPIDDYTLSIIGEF